MVSTATAKKHKSLPPHRKNSSHKKPQRGGKDKKKNIKFGVSDKSKPKLKNKNVTAATEVTKKKKKKKKVKENVVVEWDTAAQKLSYFINQYQSANGVQLSSLEIDSLNAETCIVDLSPVPSKNATGDLGELVKAPFGSSWREVLCGKNLQEGKIDPGNPALLVISLSALRSLEVLREFRSLTKECHAAKLFSKHMKIEEQVSILKGRINIACGTPNRIKKLIEIEALGLSRLEVIVLDMHTDVKGYSLFTLPQVRDEFWDLYKTFFHQPLLEGKIRLCLYGPAPILSREEKRKKLNDD